MPHEPVAATAYVLGRGLAIVNAQPSACQEPGPFYVRLSGRVETVGPLGLQPVAFVALDLVQEGKVVATAASDARGIFGFTQLVTPGLYDLRIVSDRYDARQRILLNGHRPEVNLLARAR
jgi:hypothetical protein